MSASFRVATPVQISVARDKPAEKETSGGDERFSNLLSQRHAVREETAPSQHPAAPKAKESAKSKEPKPDDTLHLLHRSAAIQPSVTPPTPQDVPAQVQAQPSSPQQAQPQPISDAVDDIVSKSPAKMTSPPIVALPLLASADPSAPVATNTPVPPQNPVAATTAQTTQADAAVPAAKPQITIPTTPATDGDQAAPVKTATPLRAFKPTIPAASTPAASPQPQATDTKPIAAPAPPAPLPAMPLAQSDKPATPAEAAKPAEAMFVQQPLTNPSSQPDISNAAPIIVASAVAAATRHSEPDADSSDDAIDNTAPTGAIPTFSLHEPRDIATADGKTPVPPPSSPEFGDALGAKLSWMAERHIGHAEIRLSPDNLGAVDVRVHLNGDRVRAEFNAANPEVRQAINDHIPRLRDMLSRHGFDLAESQVGNGSNQQNAPSHQPDFGPAMLDDDTALPVAHIPAYTHDGILDAFA